MQNKVIWFATPKSVIHTKHIFLDKEQVLLKKEVEGEEEWYPINFHWKMFKL